MAEKSEDLGIPMRPARPAIPVAVPPRLSDLSGPNNEPPTAPEPSSHETKRQPAEPRTMIVGRGMSLSGDIRACNRLVVEGSVEATLHECREMQITENGVFKGNASIEQAEVCGQFEGELTVSKRLFVRATGRVSGTITYGEIEIERGGKISGLLQQNGPVPYVGVLRAGE